MSQTAITLAFEQWKAKQSVTGEPVLLDEFVFALVPGLDPDLPVDRSETLPPVTQIVHRESVTRKGVVSENAVVHSAVLGADVGDFSFNWIGLINKASGTLAMIVHAPEQQKLKTKEGQQGNVLTRSFLMEYVGAQEETGINTPAETWQIDFTARMGGIDERQRLENVDIYGEAAFFGDGYLVAKTGNQFFVTKGVGYVAGLRAALGANQNITVTTKQVKVWLDVCWVGTLTSVWGTQSKITVAADLGNYVQNGVPHYVFAIASIDVDGNITDLRPKGSLGEQQGNSDYLRKDKNLADVIDKVAALNNINGVSKTTTINDKALSSSINVTAQDIFNGQAVSIPNAADLNAYSTPGLYYQAANAQAAAGKNYPEANAGALEVYKHAGITQVYRIYNSSRSYSRGYYGGAWSAWAKVYDTANKPSAGDVGALPVGGTAVAATKLATARAIGGVAFNGTANINLPGVNTQGNQNTTGNAATATRLQTARTINGVAFNGTANITIPASAVGSYTKAESDGRYIQGVRLGAEASKGNLADNTAHKAPAGYALTGFTKGGGGNPVTMFYKPIQRNINGAWVTISG